MRCEQIAGEQDKVQEVRVVRSLVIAQVWERLDLAADSFHMTSGDTEEVLRAREIQAHEILLVNRLKDHCFKTFIMLHAAQVQSVIRIDRLH